jgi:hypothetical protein
MPSGIQFNLVLSSERLDTLRHPTQELTAVCWDQSTVPKITSGSTNFRYRYRNRYRGPRSRLPIPTATRMPKPTPNIFMRVGAHLALELLSRITAGKEDKKNVLWAKSCPAHQ